MTADFTPDNDPRALWQSQPAATVRLSAGELREKAAREHRKLRRKTVAMYAMSVLEIVALVVIAIVFTDPIMRIGALLLMVTFGYMMLQLHLHYRAGELSGAASAATADPSVSFYRMDLQRYRDFHRGLGLWSRLALGIPAACVFFYGFVGAHPELAGFIYAEFAAFVLFVVVIGIPIQLRRARRYQQRIDELDAA